MPVAVNPCKVQVMLNGPPSTEHLRTSQMARQINSRGQGERGHGEAENQEHPLVRLRAKHPGQVPLVQNHQTNDSGCSKGTSHKQ